MPETSGRESPCGWIRPCFASRQQYQGRGEHLLAFDREGEGYVAWIHGPAGQTHELTLNLLAPLTSAGRRKRGLRLDRAADNSIGVAA